VSRVQKFIAIRVLNGVWDRPVALLQRGSQHHCKYVFNMSIKLVKGERTNAFVPRLRALWESFVASSLFSFSRWVFWSWEKQYLPSVTAFTTFCIPTLRKNSIILVRLALFSLISSTRDVDNASSSLSGVTVGWLTKSSSVPSISALAANQRMWDIVVVSLQVRRKNAGF